MKRPKQHREANSLKVKSAKNNWIRELFALGLDYEIVVLEYVPNPKAPALPGNWSLARNHRAARRIIGQAISPLA